MEEPNARRRRVNDPTAPSSFPVILWKLDARHHAEIAPGGNGARPLSPSPSRYRAAIAYRTAASRRDDIRQ